MTLPDLLVPGSDATVYIQIVAVVGVGGVAALWLRTNRDAVVFVAGAVVLLLGLIGIRAVH